MNHSARVTSKGQIKLPADIRKSLGLGPGDHVDFVKNEAGRFELVARTESLADLAGVFKTGLPVSDDDIDAWIKEARAAMATGSSE